QGRDPQEALFDAFLDAVDGLLFTGGEDIHPSFYGELLQERCGEIDQDRDHFEIELAKRAFNRRMPMLGICRGIQLFNVVLGGSLYQDLSYRPGTAEHHDAPNEKRDELIHKVKLVPGSRLSRILGRLEFEVTSTHHQVLKELAPGLKVSATALDGVIEGVEAEDYPFLVAVQWHPERMLWHSPEQLGLFRALIEASRRYRQQSEQAPDAPRSR
ncbi:MAG: gamma-glutamyl-gamma-aminobutyrate hydrolase family protein, partial [Candidatus Methylomirabilales bacterium]